MKEEESDNPRILPHYAPWWLNDSQIAPSYVNGGSERSKVGHDDDNDVQTEPKKLLGNIWVDESWKVADLKEECNRRGIKPAGTKKQELIDQLRTSSKLYDLSDAGMSKAKVTPHSFDKDLPCFPHIYETVEDIKRLKAKIMMQPAPTSSQSSSAPLKK